VDLEKAGTVEQIKLNIFRWDNHNWTFAVLISTDCENWNAIASETTTTAVPL
jgi:hypothetical protein